MEAVVRFFGEGPSPQASGPSVTASLATSLSMCAEELAGMLQKEKLLTNRRIMLPRKRIL